MHRFFVPPDRINDGKVALPEDVSRQLHRVLRARRGDRILVLDDSGWEYSVALDSVGPDEAHGTVVDRTVSGGEPRIAITLYQSVLKSDRFELVLQKGTELGVSAFVPTLCERSVAGGRERLASANRATRWRRIVKEAAEQSRRGRIPRLDNPVEFAEACDGVEGPAIIPWELQEGPGLKSVVAGWEGQNPLTAAGVFIGPEGGFTEREVAYARARGIAPVSLGDRILRAETAGIAVVAAILYELGELGG